MGQTNRPEAGADPGQAVDYYALFAGYLKPPLRKARGGNVFAECPFHADSTPSFSFSSLSGLWRCFGCGASGNAAQFIAGMEGIPQRDAYLKLESGVCLPETKAARSQLPQEAAEKAGFKGKPAAAARGAEKEIAMVHASQSQTAIQGIDHIPEIARPASTRAAGTQSYTLEKYAAEKRLPAKYLAKMGVRTENGHVVMPYRDTDGREFALRGRFAPGHKPRFNWSSCERLGFYGLWRLREFIPGSPLVLCEGESDTQTLMYQGFAALGAPGADTPRPEWAKALDGRNVYVHIEPGASGRTFFAACARMLAAGGFTGSAYCFRCADIHPSLKDPSDLHRAFSLEFKSLLSYSLEHARPMDPYAEFPDEWADPRETPPASVPVPPPAAGSFPQGMPGGAAALPSGPISKKEANALSESPNTPAAGKVTLPFETAGIQAGGAPAANEAPGTGKTRRRKTAPADAGSDADAVKAAGMQLPDMPLPLQIPWPYAIGVRGVARYDDNEGKYVQVSGTPLLLTGRVQCRETGKEKLRLAFRRDGKWREAAYPRALLLSAREVTALLDEGVSFSSEHARAVVRYLAALEQANMDALPVIRSVTRLGWADDTHFIPGAEGDYITDLDGASGALAEAFRPRGTLAGWLELMRPHRDANPVFRAMLAAAFAPPLLRPLQERGNLFIYNWYRSRGGKTAALHAAMSAWGNSSELIQTFNGTAVGMERTAAMMGDLPVAIDERQAAAAKQEGLDTLVYALASGVSKLRGLKAGGVREQCRWHTLFLATGEQELAGDSSQAGVSTRTLSLYGLPFEREEDARAMYGGVSAHCGTAGPAFIRELISAGPEYLARCHAYVRDKITAIAEKNGNIGSHAGIVSVLCTADMLLSMRLYGQEKHAALESALAMGETLLSLLAKSRDLDRDRQCVEYIRDWLQINDSRFSNIDPGIKYGFRKGMNYCVYPTSLSDALKERGFSLRSALDALAAAGMLESRIESGKPLYALQKWHDNRNVRVYVILSDTAPAQQEPAKDIAAIHCMIQEAETA